jgi:hypothetical protein
MPFLWVLCDEKRSGAAAATSKACAGCAITWHVCVAPLPFVALHASRNHAQMHFVHLDRFKTSPPVARSITIGTAAAHVMQGDAVVSDAELVRAHAWLRGRRATQGLTGRCSVWVVMQRRLKAPKLRGARSPLHVNAAATL